MLADAAVDTTQLFFQVSFKEPQLLVEAARDLGEDVGAVGVSRLRGLRDSFAYGVCDLAVALRQRLQMVFDAIMSVG